MKLSGAPRPKIIVSGILFWFPLAGVTFQFLHYLIGLRRLGFDVYYIEDTSRWVYDPRINDITGDASGNVDAVAPVLEAHGFAGRWAFRGTYLDGNCYGLTEQEVLRLYRDADAMLNVTGGQEIRDEHLACPRRIYIESDPFPTQVRSAEGDAETLQVLSAHDTHFTFGENIGAPDCDLPAGPITWLPTRQPVVVDLWDNSYDASTSPYSTITTWHNKGKDVVYRGETYYWTKDREFEKFIDIPRRCRGSFEVAFGGDPDGAALLSANGWRQANSIEVSKTVESYANYIQSSRAEFTVARDQYVRPRTGWFSDRSVCYLAAGRPVITQETGFSHYVPTGEGLFSFTTAEDVVAAVDKIECDYDRHRKAAADIAHEYFDAEVVLTSLLTRAGLW